MADETALAAPAGLISLLTGAMGMSMMVLYALGALGPFLTSALGLSKAQLGGLTSIAFGAATVLSLYAGNIVNALGGRIALLYLFGVTAVVFTLMSVSPGYWALIIAAALAGVAQALSNPTTNLLIVNLVPAQRRAAAVGMKQSGVQFGAFAAGLALPPIAQAVSWRAALGLLPVVAAGLLAATVMLVPHDRRRQPMRWRRPPAPNRAARWLMAYSLCVGAGLAAMNTYLPLYANQRLHIAEQYTGWLISALGVSGIIARITWTRLSARADRLEKPLVTLAMIAVCSAVLVPAALYVHALVWLGAIGLGGSAVAANAVSMFAVVRDRRYGGTAESSALVSIGFFGGFVVSPLLFGLLVDHADYSVGWILVCAEFGLAVVFGVQCRRAASVSAPVSASAP